MRKDIVESTDGPGRRRRYSSLRRGGVRVGGVAMVATLALVVVASPVLAHANIISGTSSCSTSAGVVDEQITWTVTNNWNLPERARVTYATGGAATLSQASFMIPASGNGSGGAGHMPYTSVTVVQTLFQSVAGSLFLNVSSVYSDGYVTSNSGEITAPTDCAFALATTPATIPVSTPVLPAIAALVSPTTIPNAAASVASATTTTTIPVVVSAKKLKIGRSINSAKRPTLLASTLPPAKPHVPIVKAATFTG
jgi:hypothetical protein